MLELCQANYLRLNDVEGFDQKESYKAEMLKELLPFYALALWPMERHLLWQIEVNICCASDEHQSFAFSVDR